MTHRTMRDGLAELSRLHIEYEHLAGLDEEMGQDAAAELSAAVGRFLVERGLEAVV